MIELKTFMRPTSDTAATVAGEYNHLYIFGNLFSTWTAPFVTERALHIRHSLPKAIEFVILIIHVLPNTKADFLAFRIASRRPLGHEETVPKEDERILPDEYRLLL